MDTEEIQFKNKIEAENITRSFFEKEKEAAKNKTRIDFFSNLVLKSNILNIKNIQNFREDNKLVISCNPIKVISNETLILNKLSNNNQDYFTIEPYVFITKKICTIYNITVGQFRIVSKKVIEHKIKKNKPQRAQETAHAGSLALKPLASARDALFSGSLALKIYNNDIDITDNYLNNIYLIAENIKNNMINAEIDKETMLNFISGNKKIKTGINDKLTVYNLAGLANNSVSESLSDFINLFINKIFLKSIPKDLLNDDSKYTIYDGILSKKVIKKLSNINNQIINEAL